MTIMNTRRKVSRVRPRLFFPMVSGVWNAQKVQIPPLEDPPRLFVTYVFCLILPFGHWPLAWRHRRYHLAPGRSVLQNMNW